MGHESHTIEAMVRGYHVYEEIWCEVDHQLRDQLIDRTIMTVMPPANRMCVGCKNLLVGFYLWA